MRHTPYGYKIIDGKAVIDEVLKLKPSTLKGTYVKSVSLCSTMSPGINIDVKSLSSAE